MTGLAISVGTGDSLTPAERAEVLALCSAAYEEDFAPYLALLPDAIHVIGRIGDRIVSHAAWVTRWLQPAGGALLRTAYIEAVATVPDAQGRGYATAVLAALPPLLGGFDIAALSPSEPGFYARLGWVCWEGALSVRTPAGPLPSPDEDVMILRLESTPPLDLTAGLSIEYRDGEVW